MNDLDGVRATHRRIADLVRELHDPANNDPDTVLALLSEHAAAEVPGAQYAGVTLTTRRKLVETPAATHPYVVRLDEIQHRHGEGPCLEAAWDNKTISVPDYEHDDRWPSYRRDALAETPVRSAMAFELFLADHRMGALNVFAERPHAFDEESREIGQIFATYSAVAWNAVTRDEQFRQALASRDIIGQSKGMIMERYGIGALQAFEMLKKLSQDGNIAIVELARQMIENTHPAAGEA